MKLLAVIAAAAGAFAAAGIAQAAPSVTAYRGAAIVQQAAGDLPLAGTTIFIAAGRDRQTSAQNGIAALTAQTILDTPVSGMPLHAAVSANGGTVRFTVSGSDVRFYVEGLESTYAGKIVPLVAAALAHPDFSVDTVGRARTEVAQKIDENERLALTVGIEMLDRTFYQNSNAGLPEYGLPAILAGQTPADVETFYKAHYRRDGMIVSTVSDVKTLPASAFQPLVDALPAGASAAVRLPKSSLRGTNRQLVTHRDVSVPWLVAQYPAPAADSKDFGAMLLLSSFITRTLTDVTQLPTIAPPPVSERGVGTLYNFDARPANLIVYIDGGLGDPARTFATGLAIVNILGQTKLHGDINDMKTSAAGEFLNGATSLEDRSWLAGVFYRETGSADYLNRSLNAINRVSVADLQRTARTYLGNATIALILPRSTPVQEPG